MKNKVFKTALNKILIVRIYTNEILKIEEGRDGVELDLKLKFFLLN